MLDLIIVILRHVVDSLFARSVILRCVFNSLSVISVVLRRVSVILQFGNVILRCVFDTLSARGVILQRVFNSLSVRSVILLCVFDTGMLKSMCFTRVVSEFFTTAPSINFDLCILLCVFEVRFSNSCSLRMGEPRNGAGNITRMERVSYHIGIRTLNARRMFREQDVLSEKNPKPSYEAPNPKR